MDIPAQMSSDQNDGWLDYIGGNCILFTQALGECTAGELRTKMEAHTESDLVTLTTVSPSSRRLSWLVERSSQSWVSSHRYRSRIQYRHNPKVSLTNLDLTLPHSEDVVIAVTVEAYGRPFWVAVWNLQLANLR